MSPMPLVLTPLPTAHVASIPGPAASAIFRESIMASLLKDRPAFFVHVPTYQLTGICICRDSSRTSGREAGTLTLKLVAEEEEEEATPVREETRPGGRSGEAGKGQFC